MFDIFFQTSFKVLAIQSFVMEKNLSGFFNRLESVMRHYGIFTVNELATKYLKYDSAQKINRLKKEGASPSAEIIADIVTVWPDINANWLLVGKGEMMRSTSNKIETENKDEPSMASIMMVLAEGYKAQVDTIKSIESKMAQESTQATIAANLNFVVAAVKKISSRQDSGLKEIQTEFSHLRFDKTGPSQDEGNKKDQNGAGAKKRGKRP